MEALGQHLHTALSSFSWDFVRERCRDDHWSGVHQFFAGSIKEEADAFYLILLEEGAVFLAGNVLPEVKGLAEGLELLTCCPTRLGARSGLFGACFVTTPRRLDDPLDLGMIQGWRA